MLFQCIDMGELVALKILLTLSYFSVFQLISRLLLSQDYMHLSFWACTGANRDLPSTGVDAIIQSTFNPQPSQSNVTSNIC